MTSEKKIDYSEHLNNRRQHKRLALFNRFPHPSEIRVDTGALLLFGGFTLLFLLSVFVAQRLPATSLHIMYTTFNGKPIPSLIIWYSLVAIPLALSLLASAALHCHKGMAMLFYFIIPPVVEFLLLPHLNQLPAQHNQIVQIWVIYIAINIVYLSWGGFVWWRIQNDRNKQQQPSLLDEDITSIPNTQPTGSTKDIPYLSLGATIFITFVFIAIVFGSTLSFYFSYEGGQVGFDNLQGLLIVIAVGLVPVYMMAGTDYAEISEVFAESIIHNVGKKHVPFKLALLSILCCLSVFVEDYFLIGDRSGFGTDFVLGCLLFGIGLLLVQGIILLGRMRHHAPTALPVGVALFGIFLSIVPLSFGIITRNALIAYIFSFFVFAALLSIATIIIIVLLRILPSEARLALGLQAFISVRWQTLRYLILAFVFLLFVIGTSVFAFIRIDHHNGIEAVIAFAILVSLPFMRSTNAVKRIRRMIAVFILSFGLAFIAGISILLSYFSTVTETLAIGIVLVTFALGWDMFTSWHVVRKHSRDFPHLTRPLLLTSYVVLSATVITFLGDYPLPIHNTATDSIADFFHYPFDHIPWVLLGMMILGYAALALHFPMEIGDGEIDI